MIELRAYQRSAVDSLYSYFGNKTGNPLIVLPTGTGKSYVLAAFLQEAFQSWSDSRVLVLTHVRELIRQDFSALIRLWPSAPCGIYSAGLGKRDIGAQILFAGIQSIHRRAYEVQRCDLVLIDEAHLLGRSDSTMYRRFLRELRDINPTLKVIGLTATPYRMDSGLLTEGADRLFTDICYEAPILDMIKAGYLVPVVPKSTSTQFDVSHVHIRGGEYISGELERAVDTDSNTAAAVEEIIEAGADRGSWLIFAAGVGHATHIRDAILSHGISCEAVTGETPKKERDRILADFSSGKLRAVTNVSVLTTGFDAPGIDLIAMLRPTRSAGLYVQMLGRGTRLAPGKDDCLVLDFARNTIEHGPLDMVHARKPGEGGGVAPTKVCDSCEAIVFAGCRTCPHCGYEFPPPKLEVTAHAVAAPVLSTQAHAQWCEVTGIIYRLHQKPGSKPTLRVDYQCGLARHSEWVCFEHSGFPREKACAWWAKRAPGTFAPATIAAALCRTKDLAVPLAIQVRPVGKYTEIVSARFA